MICKACARAKMHAEKHGNPSEYVVCRAHKPVGAIRDYFSEYRNPASLPQFNSEIVIDLVNTEIEGYVVIQAFPSVSWMKGTEHEVVLVPSRVAILRDGEYHERKMCTIIAHVCTGTFVIDFSQDLPGLIALLSQAIENEDLSMDTCTWGKAGDPERDLPVFEGRTSCSDCE